MRDKWEFNPIWIYVSMFVYLLIRIVEYATGQEPTPKWLIDLFPYILPLLFVLFDNLSNSTREEVDIEQTKKELNKILDGALK